MSLKQWIDDKLFSSLTRIETNIPEGKLYMHIAGIDARLASKSNKRGF